MRFAAIKELSKGDDSSIPLVLVELLESQDKTRATMQRRR
jgi:hypothetical protein